MTTMIDEIQTAVIGARVRTGNNALAVSVKDGRINIQEVNYPDGFISVIHTLRENLTIDDAIQYLNDMVRVRIDD